MSLTGLLLALLGCGAPQPAEAPATVPPAAQAPPAPAAPEPAQVQAALERALDWMEAWPHPARYDAILATHHLSQLQPGEPRWLALRDRLIAAQPDSDHEHRRFFDPSYSLPAAHVHRWTPPTDGSRANPNRVLTEALFCAEHGWRPETHAYTCGPMRDAGGYHSTHALWALSVAHTQGCLPDPACIDPLALELLQAQPSPLEPTKTLDLDLYAERLLFRCMADRCGPESDPWAAALVAQQQADGSWAVAAEGEDPGFRYHATMMSAWALAEWADHR